MNLFMIYLCTNQYETWPPVTNSWDVPRAIQMCYEEFYLLTEGLQKLAPLNQRKPWQRRALY